MKKLLLSLLASAAVAISASADTWTYDATVHGDGQWNSDNEVVLNGITWAVSYSDGMWHSGFDNAMKFESGDGGSSRTPTLRLRSADFGADTRIDKVTIRYKSEGKGGVFIIDRDTKVAVWVGEKHYIYQSAVIPDWGMDANAGMTTKSISGSARGLIDLSWYKTGNGKNYTYYIEKIEVEYSPTSQEVVPTPCAEGENQCTIEAGTTISFTCATPGAKLNYNIKKNNNSGKKLIEGKAVDMATTYTFNKTGIYKLWVQATGAPGHADSYGRDNIYYNVVAPAPAAAPQPSVADGQTVEENTAVEFSVPGADRVYVRSYDIFGRLGDAVEYNGNTAQVNVDLMNRRFEVQGVRNVAAGFDGTGAANTVMYNVATPDNAAVPYTVSLSHNPWDTGSAPMRAASQHGTTAVVAENGRITYTTHDVYNLSGQIDLSLNGIAMAGTTAEANGKSHVYVANRQPITLVAATSADAAPLSTNNGDELILHANPELTVTLDPFKSATLAISSNDGTVTGITDITAPTDGTTRLYNLQGVEVDAATAAPGLYIQRQGHTAKVVRK